MIDPKILDHAREAVRLAEAHARPFPGQQQWIDLSNHAFEHYGPIAAALIEAHEQIKFNNKKEK